MAGLILAVNAGSSSLKFALFGADGTEPATARGEISAGDELGRGAQLLKSFRPFCAGKAFPLKRSRKAPDRSLTQLRNASLQMSA
jgi:hypothetical protein